MTRMSKQAKRRAICPKKLTHVQKKATKECPTKGQCSAVKIHENSSKTKSIFIPRIKYV